MRLWMVWAVLAVIWLLQAGAAAMVHHQRPAILMFGLGLFFAVIGGVVRHRTRPGAQA